MLERQSNIELLRIVLMTMIVLSHLIIHGYPASDFVFTSGALTDNLWKVFLYVLCSGAVDCFMFIAGYWGIKLNDKRLFAYIFQISFYAVLTYVCYHFLVLKAGVDSFLSWNTLSSMCNMNGRWWFVFAYFGVMLVAPFINAGFDNLPQKSVLILILAMFLLYCSGIRYMAHSFIEGLSIMLMMYMLGRYLHRYPISFLQKYSIWIYLLCVIGLFIQQFYYVAHECNDRTAMVYVASHANPLCVLIGISLFYSFLKLKMPQFKIINFIASGCFASYLITDGFLREKVNGWIVRHINFGVIGLVFMAIAIVVICSLFDKIRLYLSKCIENQLFPPLHSLTSKY